MNTDVRNTWTFDLRSGQFCQGLGHLRTWNPYLERFEFCCLGLLCDRSGLADWVEDAVLEDGTIVYSYLGETQYLPLEVARWADVDFSHAEGHDQDVLISANDGYLNAFPEIANLIDRRFVNG